MVAADTVGSLVWEHRRRLLGWLLAASMIVTGLVLYGLWQPSAAPAGVALAAPWLLLAVFGAALACEYLDSSLGMGYGTTLTPLLLLAGFAPLQIVPAVLCSELLTGLAAGLLHQRDGNLDLRRDRAARRALLWLSLLSTLGAILAVALAVTISAQWFALLIALIVLGMGVITLVTARFRLRYRSGAIIAIGTLAAFNKGLSGGGYGPLVTSGQVVAGVPARAAVAITSLAEALVCAIALGAYLAHGKMIDWALALPLCLGALLSVPLATLTVRRVSETWLRRAVGIFTLVLGSVLLTKLI